MEIRELAMWGAWEFTPRQFPDPRGVFLEWFKLPPFAKATGRDLYLQQANMSVSAAGVLRGIHFAQVPPSQAKYVTCVRGAFLDVIVDIRVGSPTFGQWDSVVIDDTSRRAVFLSEGLGHAILSLADQSTVLYLCSTGYDPKREFGINPLDPDIGIIWPTTAQDGSELPPPILSDKDAAAPGLYEAAKAGLLPSWDEATRYVAALSQSYARG